MDWQTVFLVCFLAGSGWVLLTVLIGGFHLNLPHVPHVHVSVHGTGAHPIAHAAHGVKFSGGGRTGAGGGRGEGPTMWSGMLSPSAIAIFLAWFGGAGYLLSRHAALAFWIVILASLALGIAGAYLVAFVLHWVMSKEQPMDPADYEMIGVLGKVTSPVRAQGIGEMVFVRDGARRAVPARSEDGSAINRDTEVVVTRFERGVAYVETWSALVEGNRPEGQNAQP